MKALMCRFLQYIPDSSYFKYYTIINCNMDATLAYQSNSSKQSPHVSNQSTHTTDNYITLPMWGNDSKMLDSTHLILLPCKLDLQK